MEDVSIKLVQLLSECKIQDSQTISKELTKNIQLQHSNGRNYKISTWKWILLIILGFLGLSWYLVPYCYQENCYLEMPPDLNIIFRPPENCAFCHGIEKIERVSGISAEEFETKYAYNGRPVIVTDATSNWTALEVFDFYYFKEVYLNANRKQKRINCQFFPYKTEFRSLYEALSIPSERVNFKRGTKPWYIGWSNCNSEVAEILRKHYNRPYFLPQLSENAATDWIFMGGSGLGAHMHVDNVRLPSWQAQIKGSKEWILAPPPECYFECNIFKTIVNTGEIIVLDTNKWYHMTNVQPGELSITIGAEYD